MTLAEEYRALIATGVLEEDPAQAAIAARLRTLAHRLRHWRRRRNGLAALLGRSAQTPKGLYIHGPVGRGKTMLMDLFFQTTTFRHKRRAHFHEFMAEVHDRISARARPCRATRSRRLRRRSPTRPRSCASTSCTSPISPTP